MYISFDDDTMNRETLEQLAQTADLEELVETLRLTSTKVLIVAQSVTAEALAAYSEDLHGTDYPVDDMLNMQSLVDKYIELFNLLFRVEYAIANRKQSEEDAQEADEEITGQDVS